MKRIYLHFKKHVLRDLLALIPLGLSIFILKVVHDRIDRRVLDIFDQIIGFRIPGLGIAILLILLYVVGFITGDIISRKPIDFFQRGISKIPIIKTTPDGAWNRR